MASSMYQTWKEQCQNESEKLSNALGNITSGGIVEIIQHIGATSIPGLEGSSCVDIGMAVWPFPLESEAKSKLEALGYQIVAGYTESPQQRFKHESGSFQLFIFESGIADWYDYLLVGDYLRHNDQARDNVSVKKKDLANNSSLYTELLPAARQWWIEHYGFSDLEAIANELKDASFDWYVSGGWALDLFQGKVNRVHHDVDITLPRSAQLELQKYLTERGWKLITPHEKKLEAWPPHMRLELPRHQIHAHRDGVFMDILLTDIDQVWRYRREPVIVRAKEKISLRSESGIPHLAPELVLLFKSKNTSNHERAKDQADFEGALPHLDPEQRAWLQWALTATTPEHPWIPQLTGT